MGRRPTSWAGMDLWAKPSGCRVFFYRLLADGAGWVLSNRRNWSPFTPVLTPLARASGFHGFRTTGPHSSPRRPAIRDLRRATSSSILRLVPLPAALASFEKETLVVSSHEHRQQRLMKFQVRRFWARTSEILWVEDRDDFVGLILREDQGWTERDPIGIETR